MATGIPKNSALSKNVTTGLRLCYEGKRSEEAILETAPARLVEVGEWRGEREAGSSDNQLYFGDNLPVLSALLQDVSVRGRVRLVYIDPPYATGYAFQSRDQREAYEDLLVGANYIEFLRERLIFLRGLLADDGSIYVHLDQNIAFAAKLVMDEVFGAGNFRSWITRKKCNPKNYTTRTYGNVSDYLLFYTKTDDYVWHRPVEGWTEARALKEYPCVDAHGRRYKKVPVHAPGARNGATGQPWRGMTPPPGQHWQYTPETLDAMDARGEIYWSPTGNPRRKVFLEGSLGIPVQDIWMEFRDAHNQNIKVTGYPTEKNPDLLARIIAASSNPGDVVLDCFAGSGTTLGVASELGRRWIGVDNSPQAIAAIVQRFTQGLQPMGDFVSQGKEKDNEAQREQQMALFETRGTYSAVPFPTVAGFRLCAEHQNAARQLQEFVAGLTAGAVKG